MLRSPIMRAVKKVMPNGLRIVSVPEEDAMASTILVLVEAGSKYETKDINGISHFLEHMCFKGTEKRPRALLISSELDSLGAQYNAFTSHEYTGYYAKVEPKHLDRAIEIVADLYQHPLFDEKEIEKEKGVVIEEINMYEDMPQRKVGELLFELMYGDQPAGWGIAGTKDVLKKLTRDDFIAYRTKHYVARATCVVVAGKYREESMFKKIAKQFESVEPNHKGGKEKTIEKQEKPEVYVKWKESDQTHLAFGIRSYDLYHDDLFVLEVLAGILGGGMSSRLFQTVREDMGAAYYVRAGNESFTDHGVFEISAGVQHGKLTEVIKAIVGEVKKMRESQVPPSELNRVKDFLVGNMYLGLEKSDEIANFYAGQEIMKKPLLSPRAMEKKIREVTSRDILRVAKKIFLPARLNLAMIGPFKEKAPFEQLLDL